MVFKNQVVSASWFRHSFGETPVRTKQTNTIPWKQRLSCSLQNQTLTPGMQAIICKTSTMPGKGMLDNATKISYPTSATFLLPKWSLGCCKSLTNFQSSDKIDSDSFPKVFSVSGMRWLLDATTQLFLLTSF